MKKLGLALLSLLWAFAPAQAQNAGWPPPAGAQAILCVYNLVLPTLTTGQDGFVNCDSSGRLIVSGTVTASLAGTTSNASSGVATSATNVPTVSYNYGFNGTTWDQLQVDGNKFLKTVPGAVLGKTTTGTKATVAVTNTYVQALASSATRTGCTIQYIAVAGTKGYVFFGSAPADTTTSFQLTNGQSLNCAIGGLGVATDAVQVTGTATDIFVVSTQ